MPIKEMYANPDSYKKTFQYRLKPTLEQLDHIEQAAGAVRFVYNWGTDLVRKASEKREPIPNYYVLAKWLTPLKREADKRWLAQAYNASLQNGLKDLDLSVKAFFREIKKKNRVGLPGFRKKGFNESIRFSSGIKHKKNKFYVPKIGLIAYHDSRPLEGKIKQASLCKIIDKWFINVVCDVPYFTHAKLQEDANLVLNANPLATIESTATYSSCVISLGAGFLDKVLEVDATLDSPKKKKKRSKKAKNKVIANLKNPTLENNNAKTIQDANNYSSNQANPDANVTADENQVVISPHSPANEDEMAKGTRDSLRALCKHYSNIFVSITDGMSTDHQKNVINVLPNKTLSKKANRLLVRRQKKLSRSERNSKNREKARIILEKQHLKIRRRRHDFLHKLSYEIVKQYDYITIKKYDLKRIMLSVYIPLAKALRDKAWDKFIQYLQYKSKWHGKKLVLT